MITADTHFATAGHDATYRRPELSLYDIQVGTEKTKSQEGADQLARLMDIYDQGVQSGFIKHYKKNSPAARMQAESLKTFQDSVDRYMQEKSIDRASNPAGFEKAIRHSHKLTVEKYGVRPITLSQDDGNGQFKGGAKFTFDAGTDEEKTVQFKHGEMAAFNRWYKTYVNLFPIKAERESKESFLKLFMKDPSESGIAERAIGLCCPLTDYYLGGCQTSIITKANAAILTYGFLNSLGRGYGYAHTLTNQTKEIGKTLCQEYNPQDKRDMLICIEKNKDMAFETMMLDTTGWDIHRLPREGAVLNKGAILQEDRNAAWGSLGFKEVINISYNQNISGVIDIADKNIRALAIRDWQDDETLTQEERNLAAQAVNTALAGEDPPCKLAFAVLTSPNQKEIEASRVREILGLFMQNSCLEVDDEDFAKDVASQATLEKIDGLAAENNGMLKIESFKPSAGNIPVNTFAESNVVYRAALKLIPIEEIRKAAKATKAGKPEKLYSEWINEYETEILQELKKDQSISQSLRQSVEAELAKNETPQRHAGQTRPDNAKVTHG